MAKLSQAHPPHHSFVLAHNGETKIHGCEGMGHDEVAGLVQRQVTLSCELGNCLVDLRLVHTGQFRDLLAARWVSLAGERVIYGPAHPLDDVAVHGGVIRILAATGPRRALPSN
jgi:hypothetical protein